MAAALAGVTVDRARSFASVADLYDAVRPPYPDAVYDGLADAVGGIEGVSTLDLAAGTGLVTRELQRRGASVVATDIEHGMLRTLRRRSPATSAVVAAAEALPFVSASFDLVVCATAWHWIDPARAVDEIRRTVRRGGHLALWWANHRWDDGVEWEAAQSAVYERWAQQHGSRPPDRNGVGPREAADDLRARGLDVVVERELTWERTVTREQHLDVLRTHSDNLALGDQREEFVAEVGQSLQPWQRVVERLWGPLVVARVP